MSELDKIAGDIAKDLDAGNKDAASTALSQQASSLQKEDFRTLVKGVNSREIDGQGLDLTVKIGVDGVPEHYAVLPAADNTKAKFMAQYIDEGNETYAQAVLNQVLDIVETRNGGNKDAAARDYRLWAMAVDSYEKDGLGGDVSIDLTNPDAASINWQMKVKSEVVPTQLGMSGESFNIPVLNLKNAARPGDSVS